MNEADRIYHEKQVKELCALHALNNLFQARGSYSKTELDIICNSLSPNVWINPHRSILGLGNYDINVIMAALQKKGCEAVWFDKRKDPGCLDLTNICGFILNVPSEYKFGFVMLPLKRRHWITLRQIHGNFYNLDSKLDGPALIGRGSDLILYLKEQLQCKDKELFIVVSKEVEETQSWQHHYTSQTDSCFPKHSKKSPQTTTIQPKDNYDTERRKQEVEDGSETSECNTNEFTDCNNVLQETT